MKIYNKKVYNKKGLIFGAIWTVLGIFNLTMNLLTPEDFLPKQIKDIIIAVLLIFIGISGFVRAFSQQATKEDKIKEQDERNQLLELKTKSATLKILYGGFAAVTIGGLVGYQLTANAAWISTFTVAGVLLGFVLLVELAVSVYYERHM